VRTIRYYIEEGLLPQPAYQGKYSYFSRNYLDRLELIRRLKESYLPLKEIRFIMNSLSDEDVHRRLRESPLPSPRFSEQVKSTPPPAKPVARALEYIDKVMEDQTKFTTKGTIKEPQPAHTWQQDYSIRKNFKLVEPPLAQPEAEDWQRIPLAPGVELHLRNPLDPALQSMVQQVIQYA
jgi:DNA-binding transcriptional MerR regulator